MALPSFGQTKADSLWRAWNDQTLADTNRLDALHSYIWEAYLFYDPDSAYYFAQVMHDYAEEKGIKIFMGKAYTTQGVSFAVSNQIDSAIVYYKKAMAIFNDIEYKKGMGSILNNLGLIYHNRGDLQLALAIYMKAKNLFIEMDDKLRTATIQTNIGQIYEDIGDQSQALDNYNSSLIIFEELNDKNGIASTLNLIGIIYNNWEEHKLALNYFKRSLKVYQQMEGVHDKEIVSLFHNIGTTYSYFPEYDTALTYFNKCLKIYDESDDEYSKASTYHNIGTIYEEVNKMDSAIYFLNKSLFIYDKYDNKTELPMCLNSLGRVYYSKGENEKSIYYNKKALELAKEVGIPDRIDDAAESLYLNYKEKGNYYEALKMLELYTTMHDSLQSNENRKAILSQEYRYSYEKKAIADSIKAVEANKITDAQIAAQKAQLEKEKTQRYALYGGVVLLLLFGGFIYNRFRVTQQQKVVIETQKHEVEKQKALVDIKNEEILDSIIYAKRIQSAILPPARIVKESLAKSFIIYKPKDVVAGDFYWLKQKVDIALFAAADCTGHGVPGAMISVVCNNALNRSVREYGLIDPGLILDKTREIVVKEFGKSDKNVNDGMDIALCSIEKNKLSYAGANIPLWLYRNGELFETKANKQPIGNFDNPLPYTTHKFDLLKGDTLYLLSDGFVDQFGGALGKKFKVKALKDLLLSLQDLSMDKQKAFIDDVFEKWKGELDQVDDVCMIGVRI